MPQIRQLEQSLVLDTPGSDRRSRPSRVRVELEAAGDQVLVLERENAELEARCVALEGRLREERAKATSDWAGSGMWRREIGRVGAPSDL